MKKLYLLCAITFGSLTLAHADDDDSINYVFEFAEQSTQKVLVDNTNVRQQPNLKADIVEKLHSGTLVKIDDNNKVLSLGGKSAYWHKVSFRKDNKTQEGYIWGGNLAIGHRHLDGYDFLFGSSGSTREKATMTVKVLKNKKPLQDVSFEVDAYSLNGVSFKWLNSNKDLKGVDNILVAEVSGEACGIPSYTQYMLWHNKKLTPLPILMSVSDAGIFYHTEQFVFPNEQGGKANQIILTTDEGVAKDTDIDTDTTMDYEEPEFDITKSKQVFNFSNHNGKITIKKK